MKLKKLNNRMGIAMAAAMIKVVSFKENGFPCLIVKKQQHPTEIHAVRMIQN